METTIKYFNDREVGRTILGLMFFSRRIAQFITENCEIDDFVTEPQQLILDTARESMRSGKWFDLDKLTRILVELPNGDEATIELAECYRYGVSDVLLIETFNELVTRKLGRMAQEMLLNQLSPEDIQFSIDKEQRRIIEGTIDRETDLNKVVEAFRGDSGDIYEPGWKSLNEILKFESGLMSVLTGNPSHGKTTFLNCLILNLISEYGLMVACISPEYRSKESHLAHLIKTKKRTSNLESDQIKEESKIIETHVQLIDLPEERRTIESIFGSLKPDTRFLIIDPWNEIEATKAKDENKTDYIGRQLKKIKAESKERDIHTLICAHPAKPMYNRKGESIPITLYTIADSAHWANKPDVGFTLSRDYNTNITTLTVLKVRHANRNGIQGRSSQFVYNDFQFEELADDEQQSLPYRDD